MLLGLTFGQSDPLPRYMTPQEKNNLEYYLSTKKPVHANINITPNKPRNPAEWEEMEGIVLAWVENFGDIQSEIVRYAQEEGKVYIVTTSAASVQTFLNSKGVPISENIVFVPASFNAIWIRDYGPNTIYNDAVGERQFIDWIYNRPRPLDDALSLEIGAYMGVPVVQMYTAPEDLVHTGGNYMSNGSGQAFSSNLVLDENGPDNKFGKSQHDEAAVDQLMQQFFGIEEYIKMTNLPFDAIHHIDMHMKLIDEETLIVGEYPLGESDGPQIEANLQYVLNNFKTKYGRPFKVHRVVMPPDQFGDYPKQGGYYRTYANALFINKKVLVPIYNAEYDEPALKVWKEAMPGHEIIGIDCNKIIPLGGAIHCITKEIGADNPIWITHKPIRNPSDDITEWEIDATIKHQFAIEEAKVIYSINGGSTYDSLMLDKTAADKWYANMYENTVGADSVLYYLKAVSIGGKTIEYPLTGSLGGGIKYFPQSSVQTTSISVKRKVGLAFPNPASSITAIPIQVDRTIVATMKLLPIMGNKEIQLLKRPVTSSETHLFFDASTINPGVYILSIQLGTERILQKIIIQ